MQSSVYTLQVESSSLRGSLKAAQQRYEASREMQVHI